MVRLVLFGPPLLLFAAAPDSRADGGAPAPAALSREVALRALEDAPLPGLSPAPQLRHAELMRQLDRLQREAPAVFTMEEIGRSVEGRSLRHVAFGSGPRQVLLWSQMHGDEPTATAALLHLLEWVRRAPESPLVAQLRAQLTVHLVPMLNPDGAERFTRRNAQQLDINRDALALQTPEGRALKALQQRLRPVVGFNLHNQGWRTSVGATGKPATVSLLAPPFDEARSDNPGRLLAKRLCGVIRDALEPLLPGQIARYDEAFEVRAFGDNFGRWGTPSVLIELGPYVSPELDADLVRFNFIALLVALDALASGHAERAPLERYSSLPLNDGDGLLYLVLRGATLLGPGGAPFVADVGIAASRVRRGTGMAFSGRVEELGDLRTFGALEAVDATGLTVVPLAGLAVEPGEVVGLTERWRQPVTLGMSAQLMLLKPAGEPGRYRVERVIQLK